MKIGESFDSKVQSAPTTACAAEWELFCRSAAMSDAELSPFCEGVPRFSGPDQAARRGLAKLYPAVLTGRDLLDCFHLALEAGKLRSIPYITPTKTAPGQKTTIATSVATWSRVRVRTTVLKGKTRVDETKRRRPGCGRGAETFQLPVQPADQ
jgi:hypothetical protein